MDSRLRECPAHKQNHGRGHQRHGASTGTEPDTNQVFGIWQCCTWTIGESTTETCFQHQSDTIVDLWQHDEPQYTADAAPHMLPAVLSRASSWTRAPVVSLDDDMCISHLLYNIPRNNAGKIPEVHGAQNFK